MSLYNILLKIVQKCQIKTRKDGDGATWITLKAHSASGLNGIYAISTTSKPYTARVYVTIEISGGY